MRSDGYVNPEPEVLKGRPCVVIDLEMCKVHDTGRMYGIKMEIIQIGAVLMDMDFNVVSRFDRYVKPRYGRIDHFISNLTGIRTADVATAGSLEEVLPELTEWMPEDAVMVSWGMTDRSQLMGEMEAKRLHYASMDQKFSNWFDCQPMFSKKMDSERRYSLEEALIAADIVTEGSSHNGLADAYNTALLLAKMNTDADFELNAYYKKALEENDEEERAHLGYSMGDLLAGIKL